MSRLKKFQEKQRKLSRFQALKSIFSSMLITVSVVVIAVIAIPKSPVGEIEKVDAYADSIIYSVKVTDIDSAIIEDTLKITLENQSEIYESNLEPGSSTGRFIELTEDTEYKLKIQADKGFGLEVLDSRTVHTATKTGGAIISYDLLDEEGMHTLAYNIGYYISDPFDEYTSIQLRYGTKYPSEEEIFDFVTIPLSKTGSSTFIENIWSSNVEVHLFLEAFNQASELIVLDTLVFNTPYEIFTSFDIFQISNNQISVSVYADMVENVEIEYEVLLKRNYTDVESQTVEFGDEDMHFHGAEVVFMELKPEVEYTAYLIAKYNNPYTLLYTEEILQTQSVTTLADFEYVITVSEFENYYDVVIEIDDPNDIYDLGYYSIYEVTEFEEWEVNYNQIGFEIFDSKKVFTLTIEKPMLLNYKIKIGIKDSEILYNYSILKVIEVNEGVEE
ncbi:hypothetical protein RJI07_08545 [Mycoplasmatota bacterium WC30]